MRLDKFKFWGDKNIECSLDERPLKKIIAVGDEHWRVIYAPMFEVANRCFSVFGKKHEMLNSDFVDQLVRAVRRSKGVVQDDPLLIHVQTYALVLSFTSLYVSRLMIRFEVHAIGVSKKNKGERALIYPWLNIPENVEIKLKKLEVVPPVYLLSLPIFNSLIQSNVSWSWLHKNNETLKSVLDACMSNGEKGVLSGLLGVMTAPNIDSHSANIVSPQSLPIAKENVDEVVTQKPSIDDLIGGLGNGNESTPSIEDLLASGEQGAIDNSPTESVPVNDAGEMDMSLFDNAESDNNEKPEISESPMNSSKDPNTDSQTSVEPTGEVQSADALQAEFLEMISSEGTTENDTEQVSQEQVSQEQVSREQVSQEQVSQEQGSQEQGNDSFGTESTISGDMLFWANKLLAATVSGVSELGVLAVVYNGETFIGFEDLAFISFAKSDYDLDNEEAYLRVADEIKSDFLMSGEWVSKEDGSELWSAEKDNQKKEVMLIPVKQGVNIPGDKLLYYKIN